MNLFNFFSFSFHTHNKKSQADAALCGRSMVEMLGVLAIIGVLSVGAISGYSKAMLKYKLNKQTEQIGSILDYVTIHADKLHRALSGPAASFLIKLGVIPVEMVKDQSNYIYDVFNNPVYIQNTTEETARYFAMYISIGRHSEDICLNLYQMAKLRSSFLWLTEFYKYKGGEFIGSANNVYGDAYCYSNRRCLKNLTIADMHELCSACSDTDECRFIFLWDYEAL